MDKTGKVLIVGGGVSGLTLGYQLVQAGIPFQIFEAGAELEPMGGGLKLWPNALVAVSGILDSLVAKGTIVKTGTVFSDRGALLSRVNLGSIAQEVGFPILSIKRLDILQSLSEKIPADRISFSHKVVEFNELEDGVEVSFAGGKKEQGSVLVFADGVQSAFYPHFFPDESIHYTGRISYRGLVENPTGMGTIPLDENQEFFGAGKRFGFARMGKDTVGWYAPVNAPIDFFPADLKSYLLDVFRGWPEPVLQSIGQTNEKEIIRSPIRYRNFKKMPGGKRVTFMGDAAHAITPDLAQGACMGMEDGAVLAAILQKKGVNQESLRLYEQARIPRVTHVADKSRKIGKFSNQSHPILTEMRNFLWKRVPSRMAVQQIKDIIKFHVLEDLGRDGSP